jgi:xylose dehydrogenase (NAD/NADP)
MLRWGLLGTAQINRRLIPAMRAARRSTVAAVASRDRARAESYAAEWQIPVAHAGYDTLIRDPAIDAIYISLPNTLHVEWTLRALDAGKHVLCEKPLALTPDDVDRVAAVARARGRVVAEAFMYRHEPLIARVLELVADDAIGPIRTIASGFSFARERANDIRMDGTLGGGSLWDIGCYSVSAVRLVAGAEPIDRRGPIVHRPPEVP